MASASNAFRLVARAASRECSRPALRRGFKTSVRKDAAQNYTMPALSPTMTEGNIAGWRVKEGDSYSAGDVLLEIETDKATMDVEAQDDGILMKITSPDGSKGIKVGQRIAVTAEPEDDIGKLELPADDTAAEASKEPAQKEEPKKESKSETKSEAPSESRIKSKAKESSGSSGSSSAADGKQGGSPRKQRYPLYPSVESILHQNGLSEADAESIPASGPNGRLLKGDVLAYLGKINKKYPAESSARLQKLSHLDLSNIQLASKPEPKKAAEEAAPPRSDLPQETEVAMPISLSSVIATQKRVKDTLGIHLPLSTFIARASELANDDLPISKSRTPTADQLFNSVLGLDQVAKSSSKGHFFPQIIGLAPAPLVSSAPSVRRPLDIIDVLAAPSGPRARSTAAIAPAAVGVSTGENLFSVTAKSGEEKRATEYLERMKYALEQEPGRLVL